MISFFLSCFLPPNSEGSAELSEAKGACVRTQVKTIFECFTHTISILPFILTLAPSVNLTVDTLAKAKRLTHFYSVASLLEKWFACFPTSGDGLRFPILSFIFHHAKTIFCMNHFIIFRFYLYKNFFYLCLFQ